MDGYNFTANIRRALTQAREEAVALDHEYVGPEHLLLGMLAFEEGVGCTVLRNLGVNISQAVEAVVARVKRGKPRHRVGPDLPYTSRAKKVLELAMSEARELNHSYVGTEHLLLGLLREEKGISAQVLIGAGVSLDGARKETLRILGTELTPASTLLGTVLARAGTPPDAASPPQGASPIGVHVIVTYNNGAVVSKIFSSRAEAVSFLTTE